MFKLKIVLYLLCLSGCTRSSEAQQPKTPEELFIAGRPVKIYQTHKPDFIELPPLEERRKLFIPGLTIYHQANNQHWRVADTQVRTFLEKYKHHPLLFHEAQYYAAVMLDKYLLEARSEDDLLETIAYYTDILHYYQSNEFGILLQALQQLKEYWPESKIREVALQAQLRSKEVLKNAYPEPVGFPHANHHKDLVNKARQSHRTLAKLAR